MILGLWQWVTLPSKKLRVRKRSAELVAEISAELDHINLLRVGKLMQLHLLQTVIDSAEQKLVGELKIPRAAAHIAILKGIREAGGEAASEKQGPLLKE